MNADLHDTHDHSGFEPRSILISHTDAYRVSAFESSDIVSIPVQIVAIFFVLGRFVGIHTLGHI